jgi:type III pantothenate kinase
VVPELTGIVAGHVHSALGVRPLEVTPRLKLPMELAVPIPATVGADRIAAAAGALDTRRRNAIVVDIGSAITVDVVRDGKFLGGVIMAGPATALSSLGERARRLPRIDYAEVDDIFPDSFDATEPSMVLGATLAAVGGVREASRMLESRLGSVGHHVLTGGLAAALAPHFPSGWVHDEDLVLRGLHRIAELNLPG